MSLPSSTPGDPPPAPAALAAQDPAALERDLAALFVQALNLEVAAAEIDPAAPPVR